MKCSRFIQPSKGVTLTDTDFRGNSSVNGAGAVMALAGDVTVTGGTITENSAGHGGSIWARDNVTVNRALFSKNTADFGGAVLTHSGAVTATGSTFTGNTARHNGGAVASTLGGVNLTNSTVADNAAADSGGGIWAMKSVSLHHATLVGNAAPTGANVSVRPPQGESGRLESFGSVVAVPHASGPNCSLPEAGGQSRGFNVTDDASCSFTDPHDVHTRDPALNDLANNGGPTPTMLPRPGSPLVDAIPTGNCDPDLTADQPGIARPQSRGCDIGAVEVTGVHQPRTHLVASTDPQRPPPNLRPDRPTHGEPDRAKHRDGTPTQTPTTRSQTNPHPWAR